MGHPCPIHNFNNIYNNYVINIIKYELLAYLNVPIYQKCNLFVKLLSILPKKLNYKMMKFQALLKDKYSENNEYIYFRIVKIIESIFENNIETKNSQKYVEIYEIYVFICMGRICPKILKGLIG